MARIIITLKEKGQGLAVGCHVEQEPDDGELTAKTTQAVAAGLCGHVSMKVHNALNEPRKQEKKNVH